MTGVEGGRHVWIMGGHNIMSNAIGLAFQYDGQCCRVTESGAPTCVKSEMESRFSNHFPKEM